MPVVHFTPNLRRHVASESASSSGETLAEVLDSVFSNNPKLRGYILDDQGAVRKHVTIFIDGQTIDDRERLSDSVSPNSEIYIMQALSGG